MYRRATTGLEENNNKFSNCSLEKMGPVVISVQNELAGKVNCLTGINRSKNQVVVIFCFYYRMFTSRILWKSKC